MDGVHTAHRHLGSKWGSYIQWTAFSAFWISVWTCALSPWTLCGRDQRKTRDVEERGKDVRSKWKKGNERRKEKGNIDKKKRGQESTKHVGKVGGRRLNREGKKTVIQVNELEALRDWKGNRQEWKTGDNQVTVKGELQYFSVCARVGMIEGPKSL